LLRAKGVRVAINCDQVSPHGGRDKFIPQWMGKLAEREGFEPAYRTEAELLENADLVGF
jgi:hypothetical protein